MGDYLAKVRVLSRGIAELMPVQVKLYIFLFFCKGRYSLLSFGRPQLYNLRPCHLPIQYVVVTSSVSWHTLLINNAVIGFFCTLWKYIFHMGHNRKSNHGTRHATCTHYRRVPFTTRTKLEHILITFQSYILDLKKYFSKLWMGPMVHMEQLWKYLRRRLNRWYPRQASFSQTSFE